MILRWQDLPRDALTFRNRTECLYTDIVDNIAEYPISCAIYQKPRRNDEDKCMNLEFDKQQAKKQAGILHKQLEKLTQVLDKLKGE